MKYLLVWMLLWGVPPQTKESLYYQSMRLLQQKQYDKARITLQGLGALLRREQSRAQKGTKKWHLLTLGQGDALSHLARIAWLQGKKQASCLLHQKIEGKRKTLPAGWEKWNINAALRKRLLASGKSLRGACRQVPSYLLLKVSPPTAQVQLKQKGAWKKVKPGKIPVFQDAVELKIEDPAFEPRRLKEVKVPRFKSRSLEIKLKPRPRPRIVVVVPPRRRIDPPKRRPPPPVPVYQKWWFWTVIGVGVAGGVAAAIGISIATSDVNHEFKGKDGKRYYTLW